MHYLKCDEDRFTTLCLPAPDSFEIMCTAIFELINYFIKRLDVSATLNIKVTVFVEVTPFSLVD